MSYKPYLEIEKQAESNLILNEIENLLNKKLTVGRNKLVFAKPL